MLGFRNLGNTCYLNSVLSIITQCSSFDKLFKEYEPKKKLTERETSADALVKSFQQLIDLKKKVQKDKAGLINPAGIYNYLFQYLKHRKSSPILPQRQNDAMECLSVCLDVFEEASKSKMESIWNNGTLKREIIRVSDKKVVDTKTEPQIAWNIHIPKSKELQDIQSLMFQTYDSAPTEKVHYKRDEDEEAQDYEIKRTIVKTPELLIISLSRWDIMGNKIMTPVNLQQSIKVLDKSYELKGVICHMGITNISGHYYSIVCNSDKESHTYYLIDDMNIRLLKDLDQQHIRVHCYGLIYQQL